MALPKRNGQIKFFDMNKSFLYNQRTDLYDIVCGRKNYKDEAQRLIKIIKDKKISEGNKLLEVACGTGKHLEFFKNLFDCVGVDISEAMVDAAKKRVPEARFLVQDMVDLKLDETFDVVTCLFGSIGFVRTVENLRKTIECFSNLVKKGGVLIIEPWVTKNLYKPGFQSTSDYTVGHAKISAHWEHNSKGDLSLMETRYTVTEPGKDPVSVVEKYEMLFTDVDVFLEIMTGSGFESNYIPGKGTPFKSLFVCVKT